jgi:hypothetical protein
MNVLNRITDETSEFVGGVYGGGMDLATKGAGLENVLYATGGLVVSALIGTGMTMIPFQRIPFGNVIRTGSLAFVGAGVFSYGMKNMNEPLGMASLIGGPLLFGTAVAQTLGYFGLFPQLQGILTKSAEETLDGYTPMDSVTVDKTSNQPAQNYGAEEVSPQVSIAQSQMDDNLNSIREESAMGHGVTQWFGSDQVSSDEPTNTASMDSYKKSTDAFGNRSMTKDDSMANVIGGASLADRPQTTTLYDVSMTASGLPMTKEVGGIQDVMSSYAMPSAGDSGRGVTQWYAESNQSGFIGRFIAGAEGHGSVIGQ